MKEDADSASVDVAGSLVLWAPTRGKQESRSGGGGSNPDYARDRPNFACRAWARMVKNGQKCLFPERSFLNSLKCVWLHFNYITSYLGCSFMS